MLGCSHLDAFSLCSQGSGMLWPRWQEGTESLPFPPWPASPRWYFGQDGIGFLICMEIYIYKHNQQITEPCSKNLPLLFLETKAGREKLTLQGLRGVRVSVGHRSLAWHQLRCSLTRDNSVPALPYQAIQTQLAVGEIRG